MALQATLDKEGTADVGGFSIAAGMMSAVMLPAKLPRSGSTSSVASLDKMQRNASSTSLASSSEPSVPGSAAPSRIGSVGDLTSVADTPDEPAATKKKKATPEELKAATARMAAAGGLVKEAMAAAKDAGRDVATDAAVLAAQAELAASKDAKVALMKGK